MDQRHEPESGAPRPVMAGLPANSAEAGTGGSRLGRIFGRRRTYLVNIPYQVRSATVAVIGMACLLVFAAALFHLLSAGNVAWLQHRAPFLLRTEAGGDLRPVLSLLAVGLVFVAAVFVIEIFESHKTAGVVHKVTRGLKDLEAGRWATRVALRKKDNFKDMEEAFNSTARSLCDQVDTDLRGLQALESQVRLVAREFESGNREGALVMLRQVAGELQNQRERKRNLVASSGTAPHIKNPA